MANSTELQEIIGSARTAYDTLELKEALKLYQQAVEAAPDSFEAQLGLARTATRMRDQSIAIAAANECIRLEPERFEGHAALGVMQFLLDQNAEAKETLTKAVELAPDDPEPRLSIAQVHADMAEYDDAEQQLATARELIAALEDETLKEQLTALAWHVETYRKLAQNKRSEAMEAAQNVIAMQHVNPYAASLAYSNMGILEARAKHYDLAIEYLNDALRMNPHFYRAGSALGRILILRNQPAKAAEVLAEALNNMPENSANTRYAYAMALAKSGQRAEGLAQYRQALAAGLSGPDALLARVQVVWLSQIGRYTIIGIALAAILAWVTLANPSPQALTLLAVFAVIITLQRTFGKRRG